MTPQAIPKRTAWEDRFHEPAPEELLRAVVSATGAELARELRRRLLAFEGMVERVEWQGVPWRWTLVYACQMDPTRAFAYIVPEPTRAQVSIPLTVAMVQGLPLKRMKKAARDAVIFSRFIAGVYWPCWQFDLVLQLDDLVEIVQRKYRGVSGEWGGGGAAGTGVLPPPAAKPAPKRSDNGR